MKKKEREPEQDVMKVTSVVGVIYAIAVVVYAILNIK